MKFFENFKKNKVLNQDLSEKVEFRPLFMMELLFKEKPERPKVEDIHNALKNKFGDVDVISSNEALTSFSIKKYKAEFKEGSLPPQLLFMDVVDFESSKITELERSQLWEAEEGDKLLDECKYKVVISDMMAATMDYKERCEMLMDYMEAMVNLMTEVEAVWIPSAGKLSTRERIVNYNFDKNQRFIYYCVNARFFNIEGTEDSIVDTLGMYSMGLPDLQYHFHNLNPNDLVNHAYNAASYIFENNSPIKSGETIDGIVNGRMEMSIQWKCNYEMSIIQPEREVMDICPGENASGNREY